MAWKSLPYWLKYGLMASIIPLIGLFIYPIVEDAGFGLFLYTIPLYLGLIIGTSLRESMQINLTGINIINIIIMHTINFLTYFSLGALIGLRKDYKLSKK